MLTCYRYIELNPVRAGLAAKAADYPWSSYRANAHGEACELLTAHDEFAALGASAEERRAVYRGLFGSHDDAAVFDDIRKATNAGYVVGDSRFKTLVAGMLGRRVEHGRPGRPLNQADEGTGDLLAG